jgi:hypothetical protein
MIPGLQLRNFWHFLRQVSGDDVYERYIAHHNGTYTGKAPLTRQEEKWSKVSRCC